MQEKGFVNVFDFIRKKQKSQETEIVDPPANNLSGTGSETNGFATALFLVDNAPSHQKRAADALSARKMVKYPKQSWTQGHCIRRDFGKAARKYRAV